MGTWFPSRLSPVFLRTEDLQVVWSSWTGSSGGGLCQRRLLKPDGVFFQTVEVSRSL